MEQTPMESSGQGFEDPGICEAQNQPTFALRGRVAKLIDMPQFAINNKILNTEALYWTDMTQRPSVSMFLARLGKGYISTCFIPIHVGFGVLFLDQTYPNVRAFYSLNVSIDEKQGTFDAGVIDSVSKYESPAILIGGSPEDNWYHWTINWLPRLVLVAHLCPELLSDPSVKFIFHENVRKTSYRTMLELFGIDENRIIYIDPHKGELFEDLIVPTMGDSSFHYKALITICRDFFLRAPVVDPGRTWPKRFYISRQGQKPPKRLVVNSHEFEGVLREFEIAEIQLEQLTSREQVELFRAAELVVGVHGAGLINLLYCSPSCKVIFLDNERNISSGMAAMFTGLADVLNLPYALLAVDEQIIDGVDYSNFYNLHCRDVIVDLAKFRVAVESLFPTPASLHPIP